jgi:hypothetical protein
LGVPNGPLDNQKAQALVREIVRTGTVTFTKHALAALKDDKLTTVDATNVLRGGWVEFSQWENDAWRYRVRTQRIVVVVEFESEHELVVVTSWRSGP